MSINPKVAAYIGFSIKSGKIVYGYDGVLLGKKPIKLVLIDRSLSDNAKEKIDRFVKARKIRSIEVEELAGYFGGKNIKCVGLIEEHLASATENELINTVGGSD